MITKQTLSVAIGKKVRINCVEDMRLALGKSEKITFKYEGILREVTNSCFVVTENQHGKDVSNIGMLTCVTSFEYV